jgi:hypothetical protein
MITMTRRRLLLAAKALAKDGTLPPSSQDPTLYRTKRGGFFLAPDERPWPDVYDAQLATIADAKATVAAE